MSLYEIMAIIPWGLLVWINVPLGVVGLPVQLLGAYLLVKEG